VESRDGLNVSLKQTGNENRTEKEDSSPWVVPVMWSAVKNGVSVASGMWVFQTESSSFTVTGVSSAEDFDFVSVGCDWSFYGDVIDKSQTSSERQCQAMTDPDTINRYGPPSARAERAQKELAAAAQERPPSLARVERA
jgi:hypothetical protein